MPTDERVERLWLAAGSYLDSESAADKSAVTTAARAVLDLPDDAGVYVAKLTAQGLNNQPWQGKSISQDHEAMVFVDKTGGSSTVVNAVKGRLHPQARSGFEAVIIGAQFRSGWRVHHVVEYDHSDVGERLQDILGEEFPITKVADPAKPSSPDAHEILHVDPLTALDAYPTVDEILLHLNEASNVVLEGPPGTGKTSLVFDAINRLCDGGDPEQSRLDAILNGRRVEDAHDELRAPPLVWEIVQFHPGTTYDDFVRGMRTDPEADGFSLESVDGVLPLMARVAHIRADKPTLLVLDEINRANLSAVLGETIFAIDPHHRGTAVRLQYPAPAKGGDECLQIPRSLLVLGTMNTADRSTAVLDFAVRRRFRFVRVPSAESAVEAFYGAHPNRKDRAVNLYKQVCAVVQDEDLLPGHSFFMAAGDDDRQWAGSFATRFLHEVRPLLVEMEQETSRLMRVDIPVDDADLDLVHSDLEQARVALERWLEQTP